MAAKSLYRKKCDSVAEAEAIAEGFRISGDIDAPGPTEAWATEVEGQAYVFVEIRGNPAFSALAATDGYERVG